MDTSFQEIFSGVDRLFIIPPTAEFAATAVNAAIDIAKEMKVKHMVVLTAPSGEVPPTYKYACRKGSFYYIDKKVRTQYCPKLFIDMYFRFKLECFVFLFLCSDPASETLHTNTSFHVIFAFQCLITD